MLINSLV